MITSITRKEHPYVLEADRGNDPKDQTVFFIMSKTVRGITETAHTYSNVLTEKKGKRNIDIKKMQAADDKEWCRAVKRIDNFGVLVDSPGADDDSSAYDHFASRMEKDPTKYKLSKDKKMIIIKSTEDETDLKYIQWSMSPAHQEEVMEASANITTLEEGLKND